MSTDEKQPLPTIAAHFDALDDPRRTFLNDHPLINIITIALCAIIAGAETWTEVETFGKSKQDWLSRHIDLKNGIPSHDTIGRVFARLDPEQFRACFLSDVAFREDDCRVRQQNAPQNLAILRHMAINLLKQEKT